MNGRRIARWRIPAVGRNSQAIIWDDRLRITIAQLILKNILHRLYLSRALDVKALINIVMSTTNNFLRTTERDQTFNAIHAQLCIQQY